MADAIIQYTTVTAPIEQKTIAVDVIGPGAGVALAAATEAEADAEAAAVSATAAAASAAAGDISEANALTYASTASAAQQAVLDAIDGLPVDATLPLQAVSRTVLAAFTGMTLERQALLSEAGRAGLFTWSNLNHAANVAADPYQGLYVAPASDTTGASGAWVRKVDDPTYLASWWGFGAANAATNHLRLASIEDLRPSGSTVILPAEDFSVGAHSSGPHSGNALVLRKAGTLTGHGAATGWLPSHSENFNPISVAGSHIRIHNFRIENFHTTGQANQRFCIYVGTRFAGGPATVEHVEIDHMIFRDISTGVRVAYQPWGASPTVVSTPRHVKIHHNVFEDVDYQAIVPEADDIEIYNNTITYKQTATHRAQLYPLRILGCNRVHIHANTVTGLGAYNVISIQVAGIDAVDGSGPSASRHADARNVTINDNRFYGGGVEAQDWAENVNIKNNVFEMPGGVGGTAEDTALLTIASSGGGIREGKLSFTDNEGRGFNQLASWSTGAKDKVVIDRNKLLGNRKTTGGASLNVVLINGEFGASSFRYFRCCDNEVIGPSGRYDLGITMPHVSGGVAIVENNALPETTSATFGFVLAPNATGGVVKTSATSGFQAWGAQDSVGSNYRVPPNLHNTLTSNIATSPRATA